MKNTDLISVFTELRNNVPLLKYLLEEVPVGIALVNGDRSYSIVNGIFASSLGYTIKEAESLTHSDLTSPFFISQDVYYFSKLINKEIDSYRVKKQMFKKNGEVIDIQINLFPCFSEDCKLSNCIAFYKSSKPFYYEYFSSINPELHKIIEKNPDTGIFISNSLGQILFSNSQAADRLGFSVRELCDRPLSEVMRPEHAALLANIFNLKVLGKTIEFDLVFHHRNGSRFPAKTKLFLDTTDYYKNGPVLFVMFNQMYTESNTPNSVKKTVLETELLAELKQLRASLNLYQKNGRKDVSSMVTADLSEDLSDVHLTNREREVLYLIIKRKNTKEIAYRLNLAEITIRKHLTSLYRKFGVSCREELLFKFYGKKIN